MPVVLQLIFHTYLTIFHNATICLSLFIFVVGCNWDTVVTCGVDPECETTTTTTTTTEITTTLAAEEEEEDDDVSAIERDYVPLKFTVFGLPEDADEDDVKREMTGILEWILFEVEELEKDSGLKILDITAWGRRELHNVEREAVDALRGMRDLQMRAPVDQMFNVAVKALQGVEFGPVIVNAIRKDLDSLIADVRGWSQYEYVTTDFGFDVCAYSEVGMDYNDCASGAAATDSASTSSSGGASYEYGGGSSYKSEYETIDSSTPSNLGTSTSSEEGLPTMIIVVISLVSVLLFFCIVAIILFVGCRKDESDYIDDYSEDDAIYGKRERGYSDGDLSRSTAENSTGQQLVILDHHDHPELNPERPLYVDEEDHNSGVLPIASNVPPAMHHESSRTNKSSASHRSHSSKRSHASHRSHRSQGSRRSGHGGSKAGQSGYSKPKRHQPDPSVYNIREDAEDPSVHSQTRHADPSVYYEQKLREDPSVYRDHLGAADPGSDDVSSQFSRRFQRELDSLEGGQRKGGSARMDYSIVSELSEPSIADRFS